MFDTRHIKELNFNITSYDILKHYFPGNTSKFKVICCFHEETEPSMLIDLVKGTYKCFGCGESGNGFELIKKLYNTDYIGALKIANSGFISKQYDKVIIPKQTRNKNLEFEFREYNQSDIYWDQYGINIETLKHFNVLPIKHIFGYNEDNSKYKLYIYNKHDPAYYYYYGENKGKVLRINAEKKYKWFNYNNSNIFSGYDQLPIIGDTIIITSSMKDVMCWYMLGYSAIAPQGENYNIPDTFISELKNRFTNIYINYDNDIPGQKSANKLINKYDFKNIVISDKYDCKDLSDLVELIGIEQVKKEINDYI